jgi:hypothetical protein
MTSALITTACVFGGTLVGLALRKFVPDHHLQADSRDAVKVGAGMISMMAALVLGLLVSSAKSKFDSTTAAITESGAKVILLDRILTAYGPEANPVRHALRESVASGLASLWPEEGGSDETFKTFERRVNMDQVVGSVRKLQPQTDAQRRVQEDAQKLCQDLLFIRWLQIEQAQTGLPVAFLVILLFWLTTLYLSFGLLAPRNSTVLCTMFVGTLAIATAMFLIAEMNRPMGGVIKVSSGPMRKALEHLVPVDSGPATENTRSASAPSATLGRSKP